MRRILAVSLLLLLVGGCTKEGNDEVVEAEEPIGQSETNESLNESPLTMEGRLADFKEEFPDAEIIKEIEFDLDDDNDQDLIVLFDRPSMKASFSVITENTFNAITLNGDDTNFQFANGEDSIKLEENPNKMVLTLHDPDQKITVDFEITLEYDETKKEANFKIVSTNERKD